ncbi:hypothetical protein AVEN_101496-1 [Araneus ventricosus]|uniref:Uncharacterized protein n=1 Tax=Araneus ventricosus TaxID=182803 RepID=A0A4Y2FA50_ARAVE|nr:hypothetical protein AVEN_101496-1 [Araneus ventricosus]
MSQVGQLDVLLPVSDLGQILCSSSGSISTWLGQSHVSGGPARCEQQHPWGNRMFPGGQLDVLLSCSSTQCLLRPIQRAFRYLANVC